MQVSYLNGARQHLGWALLQSCSASHPMMSALTQRPHTPVISGDAAPAYTQHPCHQITLCIDNQLTLIPTVPHSEMRASPMPIAGSKKGTTRVFVCPLANLANMLQTRTIRLVFAFLRDLHAIRLVPGPSGFQVISKKHHLGC